MNACDMMKKQCESADVIIYPQYMLEWCEWYTCLHQNIRLFSRLASPNLARSGAEFVGRAACSFDQRREI